MTKTEFGAGLNNGWLVKRLSLVTGWVLIVPAKIYWSWNGINPSQGSKSKTISLKCFLDYSFYKKSTAILFVPLYEYFSLDDFMVFLFTTSFSNLIICALVWFCFFCCAFLEFCGFMIFITFWKKFSCYFWPIIFMSSLFIFSFQDPHACKLLSVIFPEFTEVLIFFSVSFVSFG